ncbi:MAG: hypothetical protein AAGO57_05965 [Pseudomonadota bacterium]
MSRSILIGIVVLAIAVGAYFFLGQQADTPVTESPVSDAIESAGDTAESAAEGASDAVGDAVEGAADAAGDAVEAVEDAANDAVDAVVDTANDVVEGAEEAASDAVDAVTEGASDTMETATDAVEGAGEAADAAPDSVLPSFLTADGFDPAAARDALAASDLGAVQKATLEAAISAAEADPNLVSGLIDQLKGALGF